MVNHPKFGSNGTAQRTHDVHVSLALSKASEAFQDDFLDRDHESVRGHEKEDAQEKEDKHDNEIDLENDGGVALLSKN